MPWGSGRPTCYDHAARRNLRPPPNCPTFPKRWRNRMAGLPIYFEQRLVGTSAVDKSGAGFTYAPDWMGLTGGFPISTTMPLINVGAHPFRHFPTLVDKSAARKRAASNS